MNGHRVTVTPLRHPEQAIAIEVDADSVPEALENALLELAGRSDSTWTVVHQVTGGTLDDDDYDPDYDPDIIPDGTGGRGYDPTRAGAVGAARPR